MVTRCFEKGQVISGMRIGDLVRKTNSFEIDHPKGGAMRIRAKAPAETPPKPKTVNKAAT
jgi:hypothetical protein